MSAKQTLYQRRFGSSKARQTPCQTVRIPQRDTVASEKSIMEKEQEDA